MNTVLSVHGRTRWYDPRMLLLVPFLLMLVGCSGNGTATDRTGCPTVTTLRGAGSTFDAPLFNQLFSVYAGTPCGLSVEYYAAGSGAGISQMLNQLVDFGATDAPLTDRQLESLPNGPILHVPVTLGAVAISYHLTGVSSPLRLSGAVLAGIYLGHVKSWDDPAIASLNAGIVLPHRAIQVLHRSDGSGTTAIFMFTLIERGPI
jgi:phosphate transport system substrate-binding protein